MYAKPLKFIGRLTLQNDYLNTARGYIFSIKRLVPAEVRGECRDRHGTAVFCFLQWPVGLGQANDSMIRSGPTPPDRGKTEASLALSNS